MNYAELVVAVTDYTENTFSVADMNTFITQAEKRIYNTVQFPALRKNVTGITSTTSKYLSCPNDYLATYSIAVVLPDGSYNFLLNKDVNFIREAYPNPTATGAPRYYAMFGPQSSTPNELVFILGPSPDAVYPIELHYFYYPESITTANTSWLGDNYDPVLLYGTLVEAYTYMKGEADVLQLYVAKYTEAMQQAKRLGDGLERQDAYRSGQVRIQVT